MSSRLLAMLGAAVLALSCAGLAGADTGTGNVASNSLGTAQASNLATAPAVSAVTPDGTVTSSTPASIVGDGGNTVSNSIASVQAGGANTATSSTGTGQVSTTSAKPSVVATTPVRNASTAVTGTAGNPSNTVSKGLVTLQTGRVTGSSVAKTTRSGGSLVAPKVTVPTLGHIAVGNPTVSAAPQVTHHVSTNLQTATVRPAANVSPNTQAGVGDLAQSNAGGSVGLAQNQGDSATRSFGTVQGGALTASPALAFTSPSRELALMLGGSNGVDGGTPNSASDSIGTAQIGSGNETDPSLGTVQIGSLHLGPTAALSSPNGDAGLGGGTGIAGANNQANNSVGTIQIGGNTANRSFGTLQASPVSENEQGTLGGTPVGSGSVTAPEQIGSGTIPNSATSSLGTVQVGAGNSVTNTGGVVQVGGGSPSGPGTVVTSAPPGTSPESGPTPTQATPGTPAAPGEPAASGEPAAAPASRTPLSVSATSSTAAGAAKQATSKSNANTSSATPSRSAVAGVAKAGTKAAAGTPSSSSSGTSILGQTLPFTGLALALITLLGLGLLGLGTAVRRFAATTA